MIGKLKEVRARCYKGELEMNFKCLFIPFMSQGGILAMSMRKLKMKIHYSSVTKEKNNEDLSNRMIEYLLDYRLSLHPRRLS